MTREDDGKKTVTAIICNVITITIAIIVSLVTTVLITKVISLSDLGIATSFITLKGILTIVCLLSISTSINRMLLDVGKHKYEYLSSIYIFSNLFCIIVYLIYVIFSNFFADFFGFNFSMMTLMFSMIFLINGCTLLVAYWNFKNKYKLTFIYSILCNPVSQLSSVILAYLLTSHKYLGRIIGVDCFNIIFGIICGIFILYKGKFAFNKTYIKKSLKICVPMIPHFLAQLLLTSCDLLMIKSISGNASAGIYSMAYTIANILYAVLIQLFNPWSPWIYRRLKNKEIDSIRKNSSLLMTLCFYLCIGLMCISPELIKLFLNDSYSPAISIVAPICIGIFFQVMYIFFYDIQYFHKKNKQIALFSVITAILNIILNYFGIKMFGYQAAAYTTLISYFILLCLHYIGMKLTDKRNFYNIKLMIILSIILLIFLISNILINNNIIFRYIILFVITICIFAIYKNSIFALAKKFIRRKL